MFADTEAIRTFGAASSAQAADLAAVASALSSLPGADAFGPVGARFLAALADAAETSRAVTALIDRLATGGLTAHTSAAAYESADARTGALVSRVY